MEFIWKVNPTIALTLSLFVANAEAYTLLGSGAISCGTWIKERQTFMNTVNGSWVLGYLTKVNREKGLTLTIDANGLFAWIDNYCRVNPLKQLEDATEELAKQLDKRL